MLDASTTRSVALRGGPSPTCSAPEVYLTEAIENWKRGGEKMPHLKVSERKKERKKRFASIDR